MSLLPVHLNTRRILSLALLVSLLGACHPPDSIPVDVTQFIQPAGTTPGTGSIDKGFMAPGGNYSLVTVRKRPDMADKDAGREILCSAPSPDWATALAMAQQLQGSGGVTGGASASLTASNSLTETVTALAGRTAGVVALRDGLYKACEAYANGVIGKDAYALILSQYGNLLVALAGSSGSGSSSASSSTPASSTPSGVAVAVSAGATPSTTASPASGQGASASPAGNSMVAQMQQEVLQALLVACISENDPTVRPAEQRNSLLKDDGACKTVFTDVVAAVPALLKPPSTSTSTDTCTTKSTTGTPDPAVMAIQKKLIALGANIKADGYWGPLTETAVAKYLPSKS